ncbi:MAG: hypothetical protein JNL67_08100 [Planctomycetaceae bacterium]|nr:hypothetical protein [Planctomycetaceae bacterium]
MTEYDLPWKEIFDSYLQDFMQLCLPEGYELIDWHAPVENQEQELPRLFPESLSEGRVADKLFRVRIKGQSQPTWVMIHTEVQVSRTPDFAQRMFVCYYRILDRFREPVVCIGVIADKSKKWRPNLWKQSVMKCQVQFDFPIVKLNDYSGRLEELEVSDNPFATVILAHLLSQASAKEPEARFRFKVELVRRLYDKLWEAEDIRRLFRFIDWVLDLPRDFAVQFKDHVHQIEMEKQMPYITSIEKLAKLEGEAIGETRGEARGEARGDARGQTKGKIKTFQELLGLAISSDSELDSLTDEAREKLLLELRQSFAAR